MMERKTTQPKQKDAGHCFSILLAEENMFLGKKIKEILLRDKAVLWVFHVTEKASLLQEASNRHPDLILSDIKLLKEKQTVGMLRQVSPFSLIVALTGSQATPYATATRRLGLDGMLEKSRIEINGLKQIIRLQSPKVVWHG